MRSIKVVACALIMAVVCSLFTGCNKVNPEGHWILVKMIDVNGMIYNSQDLSVHGISEEIDIIGDKATYKSYANGYPRRNCVMSLNAINSNSYSFEMPGSYQYALATFEGNELHYVAQEGYGEVEMFFRKG